MVDYTSWPIIVSYLIAIGLMGSEKLHWKLLYCYIQISYQIWKLSDQWPQSEMGQKNEQMDKLKNDTSHPHTIVESV
jgi:hypothetical protein